MKLKGEPIQRGEAEGEALVSEDPISFLGGLDPETGEVIEPGHALEGKSVEGKILVFPNGKGSTVGSYVLYQLDMNGKAPAGIINRETEPIVAAGAIISEIPLVHKLNRDPIETIDDEDLVTIRNEIISVEK